MKGLVMVTYNQKLACQHLRDVDIPDAAVIAQRIGQLVRCNGPEFAKKYLDNISIAIKNTIIDGKFRIPNGVAIRRIIHHGRRIKKIRDKWITRLMTNAVILHHSRNLNGQNAKFVHAFMNVKYTLKSSKVTRQMARKYREAVDGQHYDLEVLKQALSLIDLVKIKPLIDDIDPPSLFSFKANDKRSPYLHEKEEIRSAPSTDENSRQAWPLLAYLWDKQDGSAVSVDSPQYINNIDRIRAILHYKCSLGELSYSNSWMRNSEIFGIPLYKVRGKVSHLLEPGVKDRTIVQPFLAHQIFFEPLKLLLERACRADNNICTFNQSLGVLRAQKALTDGRLLFCFDASSFTDRFPVDLQLRVLDNAGLRDWSNNLKIFLDGYFIDLTNEESPMVKYGQGQPMGLGPSFHLATLTHSVLVKGIFKSIYGLNYKTSDTDYGVVGDDIFISDKNVAEVYRSLMTGLGVDINLQKSVVSSDFGEFCGVFFTKDTQSFSFKPKSFRYELSQLKSAIQYYGRRYLKHLDDSLDARLFKLILSPRGGGNKKPRLDYFLSILIKDIEDMLQFSTGLYHCLPDYKSLYNRIDRVVAVNRDYGFYPNGLSIYSSDFRLAIKDNDAESLNEAYLSHLNIPNLEHKARALLDSLLSLRDLSRYDDAKISLDYLSNLLSEVLSSYDDTMERFSRYLLLHENEFAHNSNKLRANLKLQDSELQILKTESRSKVRVNLDQPEITLN